MTQNAPLNNNLYIEADTVANVWSYSEQPTMGWLQVLLFGLSRTLVSGDAGA